MSPGTGRGVEPGAWRNDITRAVVTAVHAARVVSWTIPFDDPKSESGISRMRCAIPDGVFPNENGSGTERGAGVTIEKRAPAVRERQRSRFNLARPGEAFGGHRRRECGHAHHEWPVAGRGKAEEELLPHAVVPRNGNNRQHSLAVDGGGEDVWLQDVDASRASLRGKNESENLSSWNR